MLVIDEAHNVRKPGLGQLACMELAKRARMALGMTGTPIVTDPMVSGQHNV